MATRRRPPPLKWQPPTPRGLSFPRRHVRTSLNKTRRLEALFDEERAFGKDDRIKTVGDVPVVVLNAGGGDSEVAGVESEMLRAECRFLRMERELALKKVKRNRARTERLLRSALQTLISGRDKLGAECECGTGSSSSSSVNVCELLDDEIEAIRSKLFDLQAVSTSRTKLFEANLDDRRLPPHYIPREIQELAEASFGTEDGISMGSSSSSGSRFTNVEQLSKRAMVVEANGLMNLSNMGTSVANSCLSEMPDRGSVRQGYQEEAEGGIGGDEEEQPCSGRCRAVVRRVAEQVRFETEQWSQMHAMLVKVKEEMEQLQASRDKWEQQALVSQDHIISLNSAVEAWKKRASSEESKVNDLQTQVQVLQEELKMVRDGAMANSLSLTSTMNLIPMEKHELKCQQKENHDLKNGNNRRQGALRDEKKKLQVLKRSPFLDIGNSSPLMRQITKVVFPSHRR